MRDRSEETLLTIEQVAARCGVQHTFVRLLLEHGVIEVQERRRLLLSQDATLRINKVVRLQRDLGVNVPGASVILELLERIDDLERQLRSRRLRRG
jgi:DNA-binding transcriptional MerR regulator